MSTQVQRRKGTTAQHASFTGASAELTVDTTKNTVVVHDGATAGGIPLAKETGSALSVTSFISSGSAVINVTDNTNAALRITQLGTGNALLVEDSTNPDSSPFVIDTAGRVAIGHTATVAGNGPITSTRPSLQVHGLSNSTSGAGVYNWSSTASLTSAFTFNRSLSNVVGTLGSAVTSGTSLGALSFSGDDGVSFYEAARIQAQADAAATTGSTPGRLTFSTTPTGSTTPVERLRIGNSGDITIAGGTANGVTYLNGSKVLTSGTALTFDGTNFATTGAVSATTQFISLNSSTGEPSVAGNFRILLDNVGGVANDTGMGLDASSYLWANTGTGFRWTITAAEQMRLTSTGLGIGTSSPLQKLHVSGIARVAGATNGANGDLQLWSVNAAGSGFCPATISNISTGSASSALTFSTSASGTAAEVMRLDASGNLLVGATVTNLIGGGFSGTVIQASGRFDINRNNDCPMFVGRYTSTGSMVEFYYAGALKGSISTNGTTIAYNTSSDYRLKNITGPITTSGAYIDSLKPVEGTWKADGATFVGLIAHETQEASRTTVATGAKDGDEMQGMDYSSAEIIANLIAELQDLRKRLAAAGIA